MLTTVLNRQFSLPAPPMVQVVVEPGKLVGTLRRADQSPTTKNRQSPTKFTVTTTESPAATMTPLLTTAPSTMIPVTLLQKLESTTKTGAKTATTRKLRRSARLRQNRPSAYHRSWSQPWKAFAKKRKFIYPMVAKPKTPLRCLKTETGPSSGERLLRQVRVGKWMRELELSATSAVISTTSPLGQDGSPTPNTDVPCSPLKGSFHRPDVPGFPNDRLPAPFSVTDATRAKTWGNLACFEAL